MADTQISRMLSSAVKAATAAKYHEEMVPFPGGLRIGKNGRIRPDANSQAV